jgi:putative RecB family exonuclease
MAKKIKLSATRINNFLTCKQKYWFNYVDNLPKLENASFKLGLAVHESLEFAGNIWKSKEKFSKTDIEKILSKYDEVSIREGINEYDIHVEGRELVKKRLSNFMSGRKLLGLEIKFGFWGADGGKEVVSDLGVPLIGSIDKVEEYNDDTIVIVDYKTSKTAPTGSQMRNDIQLSLYDLVARKLFPQYKRVVLALDLLKSEILFTYRTDEQRRDFELYIKTIYDSMLNLKQEDVKASLNMFCPWCDYKDYCSTYQKACKKSDYNFLPTLQYSDEKLVQEWETVKSVKKILESRERELGMIIMEKIKLRSENISNGDNEVYVRQNSSTSYDFDTVLKYVPEEDFPSLVNLNKKAVETYMSMNPSVKEVIADSATTNYTSPFLMTRKKK